ncbi:MAG: hypothetical protein ACK43L_06840, partial [Sphingobacteriales bacterium]
MPLSTQFLQVLITEGTYFNNGNTGGIMLPLIVKEGEIANDATNITHGTITASLNLEKGKTCDTSPPIFLGLSSWIDVPENTVYVVDINTDETVTLSLSGDDAAKFEIMTNSLKFKTAPDYETKLDKDANNKYQVSVIATDAAGNVATRGITVTVTDVVESNPIPTIYGPTNSTLNIPENTSAIVGIYTFTADRSGSWSLAGPDASKFFINGQGVLTITNSPDFETPGSAENTNTYQVTVVFKDNLDVVANFPLSVTVTDVDEILPFIRSTGIISSASNNTNPTNFSHPLYQTNVYDFDANRSDVIFSISGGSASLFTISNT